MPLAGGWFKVWLYFGFVFGWSKGARPRFDTSTDMGLVLVPADAEIDSVIYRLRATDQDADFPLVFDITATITPVVRIENLPCTLYNKVCQANVILTRRLIPGRLHDFAVRVRDSKGDVNTMQATLSVTNATTPRDQIFPHIPSLIMVPEDTKPGKELDYLLVRANPWSGKPVYIELWQPKELFTIRQRQTPTQTRGVITLIGELDFETQSMYTLTMYATDPYTEPGKDTRNIAGLNVVVVVQDVQDVPPIFTLAPPLTRINNSVQPGDIVLRVHAEDGDKGVPREVTYGLVSEGNPFTPFFNISETTGEIVLARPLEDLTQITHVGAPVVLSVVAEEIRRTTEEPPAQATVVEVGFLLGEPGNSPPYFESDNYVAVIDENPEPGSVITFPEQYSTKVRDEDIGKAGVFALKLENNNGTFEINPTVAERNADFIVTVRDNSLIDYELYKSLTFKITAQEVGPATNLSTSVPVTIFLRDVNDNPPVFDEASYQVTLSENVTAGTRVVQVHASDKDTGSFGSVQYTRIIGDGSEAFTLDPDTGSIIVSMGSSLDREATPSLQLSVEARDEDGKGNRGTVPLIVNLLDVNDNAPIFEKEVYEFTLNSDLTNFTTPAVIKAIDADAEPPNNEVRYELVHGNYENKFHLNEITGELILRSPITKVRRKKQSTYENIAKKIRKEFVQVQEAFRNVVTSPSVTDKVVNTLENIGNQSKLVQQIKEVVKNRRKRDNGEPLYTLTARAYDLGVPHMSSVTQIRVSTVAFMEARIVMFVVPGDHPDPVRTAETLSTITGGRVIIQDIRPYVSQNQTNPANMPAGKKSVVLARVQQNGPDTPLVDIEKIRETLAANGVGIIGTTETVTDIIGGTKSTVTEGSNVNGSVITVLHEEATIYKAENRVLFWLLLILGLLMLAAIATLILCCICPSCPFYMAPRKRRVHSSEALVARPDGRPKRHLHRPQATAADASWTDRKQAWSADATRRNWQFNRRNTRNLGLASLPGDVAYISGRPSDVQMNVNTLRLRDGPVTEGLERDAIYAEDMEAQRMRGYEMTDVDSLQQHELERGSDGHRQSYRYVDEDAGDDKLVREQHFYREGNAEVLRLVTRGPTDESQHQETTLVVDGKDILLRRFMEDQRMRHDISMQDIEATRSMESHQRPKEVVAQQQPEIILLPERLDVGRRSHLEDLGPDVHRLIIDRRDYDEAGKPDQRESQVKVTQQRQEAAVPGLVATDLSAGMEKQSVSNQDHGRSVNVQSYTLRDMELARQNALLTRLLLERDSRGVGLVVDSTSYLETQSLPGQVAIATQTDRSAGTQTERQVRSRSDNDESDDDTRQKKKLKNKKRHGEGDTKRRTLWMKSPIEEEGSPGFDKRLSILRKKVKEVKDSRKGSLEPDVLREISDSLDGTEENESTKKVYRRSTEETSIRYKVLNDDASGSSTELSKEKYERAFADKSRSGVQKCDVTESTSSPEITVKTKKVVRGKTEQRSPKKEDRKSSQKNVETVVEPSFRVLEKEITLLTKKLSKLGAKKIQDSTGSESNNHDKVRISRRDLKKETEQRSAKKSEASSARDSKSAAESGTSKASLPETAQRKESFLSKTRQKLKYQKNAVVSTGSSEYEDSTEKPKKQVSVPVHDSVKHKPSISQAKVKRQSHFERKDPKKSVTSSEDRESQKEKTSSVREASNDDHKMEKTAKVVVRGKHLASIGRRDHVSEDLSTSTSSDKTQSKKDKPLRRESERKTSTETSESVSERASQRKVKKIQEKATAKVEESEKEVKSQAQPPVVIETKEKRKDSKNETDLTATLIDVADKALNGFVKEPAMSVKEVLRDSVALGQAVPLVAQEVQESALGSTSKDAQASDTSILSHAETSTTTEQKDTSQVEKKSESDDDTTAPEKTQSPKPMEDDKDKEKSSDETSKVVSVISEQHEVKLEEPKVVEKLDNDVQEIIEKIDTQDVSSSALTNSEEISLPKKNSDESSFELLDVVHEETSKTDATDVSEAPTKIESIQAEESEVQTDKTDLTVVHAEGEKADVSLQDSTEISTKTDSKTDTEATEFLAKEIDFQTSESLSKVSDITAEMIKKEQEGTAVQSAVPTVSEDQSKSTIQLVEEINTPVKEPLPSEKEQKGVQPSEEVLDQSSEEVQPEVVESQETMDKPASVEEKIDTEHKEVNTVEELSTVDVEKQIADSKEEKTEEPVLKEEDKEDMRKDEEVKGEGKESGRKEEVMMPDNAGEKEMESKEEAEEKGMEGTEEAEERGTERKEEPEEKGMERKEEAEEKGTEREEEADEKRTERKEEAEEKGTERKEEPEESRDRTMQISDVSTPIFTSAIDTLSDSDDSDTSSDISRETTLAAGPYQTPRHRARKSSELENIHAQELVGENDIDDAETLAMEVEEKADTSIQEKTEEPIERYKDDAQGIQQTETVGTVDAVSGNGTVGYDDQSKAPMLSGTIIPDITKPLISSDGIAKDKAMVEIKKDQLPSTIIKDSTSTDVVPDKPLSKGSKSKIGKGTEKGQIGKDIHQRASDKRSKQQQDRLKVSPTRKEKKSSEQSSQDKTVSKPSTEIIQHPRHRSQRPPEPNLAKRKDIEPTKQRPKKKAEDPSKQAGPSKSKDEKDKKDKKDKVSGEKLGADIDVSKTQSKYMSWYKDQREETERKRLESKEDDDQLPRWVKRSLIHRRAQQEDKRKADQKSPEMTPRTRRKVKPLVNAESEQLKAIVRQGRKLRKAEGANEDPTIQIFATEPPPPRPVESNHHLLQHSAYKFERMPPPFYLHPPPVPHPSPQLSPQRSEPRPVEYRRLDDDLDSGIAVTLQGGSRLRHQQLLEKKSVFDIAYSEAAPPQLRADSTTPPS